MSTPAVKRRSEPLGESRRFCPTCESPHLEYEFVIDRSPVCGCQDCGLLFLNPFPPKPASEPQPIEQLESDVLTSLYQTNAAERLQKLMNYAGFASGNLLLIGTDGHLVQEAKKASFTVSAFTPEQFEDLSDAQVPRNVNGCILFCALERMREPLSVLIRIRNALVPRGSLMVLSPTLDSATARLFQHSWWEFNRSNLFYFTVDTLQNLLIKAGFGEPLIAPDRSLMSLNYLRRRLASTPRRTRRLRWLRSAVSITPLIRNKQFRLLHSRTRFLVRAIGEASAPPRISVVVPVFNEKATCAELLDQLLAKTIEGVDIEVIIVESNSTDGSREVVLGYRDHPAVKLLLEPKPMGKGHAVRTGLKAATGDIILFQDADLEYDLNDYEGLIAPLLRYQQNFVLGSRHSQTKTTWKIRKFSDAPGLATFFNLGHLLFLTLFNTLYSQRLSDPFTMFKVFRRECLYGLSFECNRFDFDYEIVIKLLRKGYRPKELPVNYTSRSIAEGKKVTMFRDPLTWIRALLKFKRTPLYDRDV